MMRANSPKQPDETITSGANGAAKSSDDRRALRQGIAEATADVCRRFPRSYWIDKARSGGRIDAMWKAMAESGLLRLGVPETIGGLGGGMAENVLLMEALAGEGVPHLQLILTSLAHVTLARHGTSEQCHEFVEPSMSAEKRICLGVTEVDAGSNTFQISTTARPDGDGWRISGQKSFISCADESHFMLTIVRSPHLKAAGGRMPLSVFVIPLDSPGIELQEMAIDIVTPERQFTIFLTDVELGRRHLVGTEGQGVGCLFDALNAERLIVAALNVGIGQYALRRAVEYAKTRSPFGQPIGAYQAIQHPLARIKAQLEAVHLLTLSAAERYDEGEAVGQVCNMAKLLASEVAVEACDHAVQVHGGYAFSKEVDVINLWAFARLSRIAPINNEMILNSIAHHVLGLPRSY